jgi:hypothetical protein
MATGYWQQVIADGLDVPTDRPLTELTAELTTLLGSVDPADRDGTAYPTLATWIDRGVYDGLLTGLGDGMASGLLIGLGESGTDSVFRRSFSVLVLTECIVRDNQHGLLPPAKLLEWGDRITGWYLRERDLRGYVPGRGWAHALAHGADAIGALATSAHLATPELTVLMDVLADRLLLGLPALMVSGEPDRMATAMVQVLRRDLLPMSLVEPWVIRLAAVAGRPTRSNEDRYLTTGNAEAFLRALYLQLALGPAPPPLRADLVLVLVDALRRTNPDYLGPALRQ